ncbi:PfkB family carbohydrate kinase [uncultured Aeromicrobium sp.]|uniref:PfkB family carbohydrate kinase n=1 Tax=uncultured Aeromicrobium sp. TaxID=337820 RepID=UPI0025E4023A|nr:PfkB family carbohydrate kinase [uncultured Aeromicrobium sp.]
MSGQLVVVGAVNVDLVVAADRLPGPGETVVGPSLQRHGGGKGGNAAVAAARSGARVRYVGAVGPDDFGSAALAELESEGVDVGDVVIKDGHTTGAALIVVDPAGENQIAVAAGANAAVTSPDVDAALERADGWVGCLLVSTEIAAAGVVAAVTTAVERSWPCVLNPAPVVPGVAELLELPVILTPNRLELRDLHRLLGGTGEPPVEEMAARVAGHTGAPVVVTLGSAGLLICSPAGEVTAVAATRPRRVVDTTGAGDTFNGVFAAGLAAGADLAAAARRGAAAAAASVEEAGARAGMPDAHRIDALSGVRPTTGS